MKEGRDRWEREREGRKSKRKQGGKRGEETGEMKGGRREKEGR